MANMRKCHYGLVTVSDGKCQPQILRLKLSQELILLQREEFVFPEDEKGYPVNNKLRVVRLNRHEDGSLGIGIKGGVENNLPILISKVCTSENDDHLYIGDAILKVNEEVLSCASHDEAINILRNGGPRVVLTVKHYKSAAPFLLKNFRQLIPESGDPFEDRNKNPSETKDLSSPGSVTSDRIPTIDSPCSSTTSENNWNGIPRVRRRWIDYVEVPLLMAYITRYIHGTDKIRPNAFEVRGLNGSNTGVIHSPNLRVLSNWIKLISDYIMILTSQQASLFNRHFPSTNQISYMGWVAEGILNRNQPWQNWRPKFFALKGREVCILDSPPTTFADWSRKNVQKYNITHAMLRIIKESENVDERQHCFLIQTSTQESRYFSMETRQELLRLESYWHRAVCQTVSQLESSSFHVVYKNRPGELILDWNKGFLLRHISSSVLAFSYDFCLLKGSSDDGNEMLTLLFRDSDSKEASIDGTVSVDVICPKLQDLLFFMHSFLTAKVASMDPLFLSDGRNAISSSS